MAWSSAPARCDAFASDLFDATLYLLWLLLAPFGHDGLGSRCPFLRVKQTPLLRASMSESDPFRTLGSLTLAELFAPRPGQHEVFWMGLESCSLL